MKYTLSINQKAIIDNELDLSLVEAVLLDVIVYMTLSWDEIVKIEFGGRVFFWLDYERIQAQAPMLGITKDRIYRHIKSLCDKGFLMPHPDSQTKLQRPFFAILPRTALAFGKNTEPSAKTTKGFGENNEGGSVKTPNYNSIIDNTIIDNEIKDKSFISSGDQKNAEKNDFSDFDAEAAQRGFSHVLKIKTRFTKEKVAAKRKEFGDDFFDEIFWGVISQINAYLDAFPKKVYTDLPKVFTTFLGTKETFLALYGLNAYWTQKHGAQFSTAEELRKSQKEALGIIATRIAAEIKIKSGAEPTARGLIDGITLFFQHLPARWANPAYFKLEAIANEVPQIIAAIKNPQATQGDRPKTYKEIDAENAQRARQEEEARRVQFYQDKYYQEDAQRIRGYLSRNVQVPSHLMKTQAYRDIIAEANSGDDDF